ncbi:MAG TPA: response regulator transcription factor [Actinobacteria bacterium]|nr:response regulator transcription factor [Actinomycetota bacterium]
MTGKYFFSIHGALSIKRLTLVKESKRLRQLNKGEVLTTMQENTTSVLVIEEHDLLREGLESIFRQQQDFEVIASTSSIKEAVKKVYEVHPQIIILGINIDFEEPEVCSKLIKKNPGAKILLLAPPGKEQVVADAFKRGASGCVLTNVMSDDLVQAIRMVTKGQMVLPQNMAKETLVERRAKPRNLPDLTIRELEVLQLMANGLRNREIAKELFISEVTVKTHVSRIFKKLNLNNRTAAILHAHKRGWIHLSKD